MLLVEGKAERRILPRWIEHASGQGNRLALGGKLRDRGIWLWPAGDIECHFGLGDKDEAAWHQFEAQLAEADDWRACVPDEETVGEFLCWLESIVEHRIETDHLHQTHHP